MSAGGRTDGGGSGGPATRILGMGEVRSLLTLEDAIELQRHAFSALARGRTAAAPNAWLRLPREGRGWLKLLAGYDADSGGLGVKVVARFPSNPPGANFGSLLLLFDERRGTPLAILDGIYVTAVRTAAGAAIATEALARPGSRRVAAIGTGVLGWYSVLAHRIVCPELDELTVFSRSEARRERFAERARDEAGIDARAVATIAEACEGVDVIVTATNSPEPVLAPEHLVPGVHIAAIGIRNEIEPEGLARCRVIPDGRAEAINDGKFSVALASGVVTEEELGPELGAVLEGLAPGRRNDDEMTLLDSSGVAIQDIVCARHVSIRAEEEDVGALVALGGDVLAGEPV